MFKQLYNMPRVKRVMIWEGNPNDLPNKNVKTNAETRITPVPSNTDLSKLPIITAGIYICRL